MVRQSSALCPLIRRRTTDVDKLTRCTINSPKTPDCQVSNPTASYWQTPPHKDLKGIKSPKLPTQRDIIILGSGITACSVSRELLRSGYQGTIAVLEAREVCSGATGRNGCRINCVAVQDFDKYHRLYGSEIAKQVVRFELAHYEAITEAARELGDEAFKWSEIRPVEPVAAVFSDKKLAELKEMLAQINAAFPDLAGRWKVVDKEASEVFPSLRACRGESESDRDKIGVRPRRRQGGLGRKGRRGVCLSVCHGGVCPTAPWDVTCRTLAASDQNSNETVLPASPVGLAGSRFRFYTNK